MGKGIYNNSVPNTTYIFPLLNSEHLLWTSRCTWGPSLTMTPPRTTSSHAKRPDWSLKLVTSFRSSTSRIPTGGRADWRATLPTSPDSYLPQSSKNGKQLRHTMWQLILKCLTSHAKDLRTVWPVPRLDLNLCMCRRRVASKSKAREGSQSCSPFGKKKKCKDKYLAKHSSSEWHTGTSHCTFSQMCCPAILSWI